MKTTAALVVTTYNNPRYLGICLKSLSNQSSKDFDVFVADDGSTAETKAKIESLRGVIGRPVQHFWHPDAGYNKSKINNTVFRELGDYRVVICIDHDVIAHERFVEDHLAAHVRSSRVCFMGRRVDLGPQLTARIGEHNVTRFNQGLQPELLWSGLRGDTRNFLRSVRIGNRLVRRLLGRDDVPDLLGSNFSLSRELLFEVNGYNEEFQAYWGEDGDLFVRLRNSGAALFGSKALAIQYHLHHPRLEPSVEHQKRYQTILADRSYTRCGQGIVQAG